MPRKPTRRAFLEHSALATAGLWSGFPAILSSRRSPNEKLDIGVIGVGGRGAADLAGVASENIVALCDVNEKFLAGAGKRFPAAKLFTDFRQMLALKNLDAVVVATPDHTHAVATVAALRSGRHVYCEKPLTHSLWEAREVQRVTRETKLVTQMGTQIHAGENYRRVVELVESGAIGTVSECHVWCGKSWSGGELPKEYPPVPPELHYDLWLGPAPERPYHPAWVSGGKWRRWWAFGSGTLGDMGCHYVDLAQWALKLRHPVKVQAHSPKEPHPETTPPDLTVRYSYPQRGQLPPLELFWYDTRQRPPQHREGKIPKWGSGVLFIGSEGWLLADYGRRMLLPEEKFKDFKAPAPYIPKSIGHHKEWIEACKSGETTSCNFDYAGVLTETILLGNLAYRLGREIEWDAAKLEVRGHPEAAPLIRRKYRAGWKLS